MGSDPATRATFYLVIREGTEAEQIVIWDTVDVTVGRRMESDVVIEDGEVSRDHARFHRRGSECFVENLSSGLGTQVNGEAVKRHALQSGDRVTVGPVSIRFAITTDPVKRASNVSFASELKEFGLVASGDAAGQTMLAFDGVDDSPISPPTTPSLQVRAITLDGEVDLADPDSTAMELALPDEPLMGAAQVRDLDIELASESIPPVSEAVTNPPTAPTLLDPAFAAQAPVAGTPAAEPERVKMVLEIEGPPEQVRAFLEAVRDKRISVPPLSLLLRDL